MLFVNEKYKSIKNILNESRVNEARFRNDDFRKDNYDYACMVINQLIAHKEIRLGDQGKVTAQIKENDTTTVPALETLLTQIKKFKEGGSEGNQPSVDDFNNAVSKFTVTCQWFKKPQSKQLIWAYIYKGDFTSRRSKPNAASMETLIADAHNELLINNDSFSDSAHSYIRDHANQFKAINNAINLGLLHGEEFNQKFNKLEKNGCKVDDEWKKYGATENTPKTDIKSEDGKIRISVKKLGSSQLMSGRREETLATFRCVLDKKLGKNEINELIKEVQKAAQEILNKQKSSNSSEQFTYEENETPTPRTPTQQDKQDIEEAIIGSADSAEVNNTSSTDGSTDISVNVGLDPILNTILDAIFDDSKWLKEALLNNQDESRKVNDSITEKMSILFKSKTFKRALAYEALTGELKFAGCVQAQPNYVLVWSMQNVADDSTGDNKLYTGDNKLYTVKDYIDEFIDKLKLSVTFTSNIRKNVRKSSTVFRIKK